MIHTYGITNFSLECDSVENKREIDAWKSRQDCDTENPVGDSTDGIQDQFGSGNGEDDYGDGGTYEGADLALLMENLVMESQGFDEAEL